MFERQSRSRTNTASSTIPQIEVQAPLPRGSSKRAVPRDTGFPEPFDKARNTTLPHPDADLSPNATLSSDDVSTERTMKRDRLSFLKKNNKRTVSHGTLDPLAEALRSNASVSKVAAVGVKNQYSDPFHHVERSSSSLRLSRDEDDSLHSSSKKGEDDTPPTSPDVSDHRRKSGIFNRWKRN
ncbi:hypothetical protein E4U55_007731 [Claviceps digitariae]|nr:hypothetical protein E4U55_007731 [Claviceps digitariae]